MVKGYKHTEEWKKQASLRMKGASNSFYGKKHSEETKAKFVGRVSSRKGAILTEETKRKMALAKMGEANPAKKLEVRLQISKTQKGKHSSPKTEFKKGQLSLEKHPNWKGGKSFEPYSIDWTNTLKRSIRERDYYTCQICKEPQGDVAFAVHHIDYNKKNCDPKNLITLCSSCHIKTNYRRDYWIKYFNGHY